MLIPTLFALRWCASMQGVSKTSVWIYMNTPLGPGVAQISEEAVARHLEVHHACLSRELSTAASQ